MPDYSDKFDDWGVESFPSPPQPVNERDIVSSTRTMWEAWFKATRVGVAHRYSVFNTEAEALDWIEREYRSWRK